MAFVWRCGSRKRLGTVVPVTGECLSGPEGPGPDPQMDRPPLSQPRVGRQYELPRGRKSFWNSAARTTSTRAFRLNSHVSASLSTMMLKSFRIGRPNKIGLSRRLRWMVTNRRVKEMEQPHRSIRLTFKWYTPCVGTDNPPTPSTDGME